jgi:YD repeat-containing protein
MFFAQELFCQELPTIIPPSPEASSLFKYLDYPVSNSTGVPEISIPIYVVNSGELSVPISLNYHASGRKVFDQDGTVALGWTLNAGGLISRTVYGDPDFGTYEESPYSFPDPFLLEDDIHIQEDFEYLAGIENLEKFRTYGPGVNHWHDSEYDVYSYSLGQSSGHLVFKDVNRVKTPVFIPMKPYLVEKDGEPLDYIMITDERGNSYKFSDKEMRGGLITSWALTEIVSANKKDIIEFKYANFHQDRTSFTGEYRLIDDWQISGQQPFSDNWDGLIPYRSSYSVRRLSEIDFKKGKVIFNHYTDGEFEGMINEIQIIDQYGVTVKRVQFEQTLMNRFTEGVAPAHKLDKLTFIGKNGENEEIYAFDYYPTILNNSGLVDVRAQDYWGYYNADMTPGLIPYYENIEFIGSGGGISHVSIGQSQDRDNRLPDHEATKSGVLRKITYPTGGETEFIYGQNKYFDQSSSEIMDYGGLRINQIITTDGEGNTYYKTYDYGDFGYVSLEPKVECLSYENRYVYFGLGGFSPGWGGTYRERVFTSSFLPDLEFLASQPIIYPEVTEYHGTETVNTGKTVYTYNYRLVTPRPLQTQQSPSGDMPGINMIRYHVGEYNLWDTPMLEHKLDYKRTGQVENPYQLVKSFVNHYEEAESQSIAGLHVVRTYIFPQDGTAVEPNMYADKYAAEFLLSPPKIYGVSNYSIPVGWKRIEYTSETEHFEDGSSTGRRINYTYNDRYLLSETNTARSDGKSIITLNQYPFEYSGNAVLTSMVSKNMLDYVVEQKEFLDDTGTTPLKSVKTNYIDWGNDVIAPVSIETSTGANLYEERLAYAYDKLTGNIKTVSKDGGPKNSFLWGYNDSYPIAKIENAENGEGGSETVVVIQPVEYTFNVSEGESSGELISLISIPETKLVTIRLLSSVNIVSGGSTTVNFDLTNLSTNQTYGFTVSGTGDSHSTTVAGGSYRLEYQKDVNIRFATTLSYDVEVEETVYTRVNEVMFENFEEHTQQIKSETAHTGHYVYRGSFSIELQDKIAGDYVLTYWSSADGTDWTKNDIPITVSSSSTSYTIGDSNTYLDDIRLHPVDAMMTTYTYDPLVGMTSQTDPAGVTIYYEYDDFGRLKNILDDEGNLVQQMEYHYSE